MVDGTTVRAPSRAADVPRNQLKESENQALAKLRLEPTTHAPVLVKGDWRLAKLDPLVKLSGK